MFGCREETAGVAAVARRVPGNGNMSSRTESVGFGDLPLHVLENLMYHVLQLGDVDAVRSCRLVCKAWNSSGVMHLQILQVLLCVLNRHPTAHTVRTALIISITPMHTSKGLSVCPRIEVGKRCYSAH